MMVVMVLLIVIIFLLIFPAAIGYLVLFNTFVRGKRFPADKSNIINHIRLVWFALTREDKFVDLFPWLKNDEWDNFK